VAVKPVSVSLVGNVQDPCQQGAGTSGNINLTASGQLITGASGKLTYICSMNMISATAQNIALVEGTGSTCGTGTAGMAGGTTAATGWNFGVNSGFVNGGGGFWVFKTATPGDNVCLLLSGSGQTSGSYRQVQQ
jgi:D-arabinose 5-phosphate isomerase GutQ